MPRFQGGLLDHVFEKYRVAGLPVAYAGLWMLESTYWRSSQSRRQFSLELGHFRCCHRYPDSRHDCPDHRTPVRRVSSSGNSSNTRDPKVHGVWL